MYKLTVTYQLRFSRNLDRQKRQTAVNHVVMGKFEVAAAPASEPHARRVLIVDDEPALLRAFARILRANGWDTTTCLSGAEAADLLAHESFDLVLTDLDMPGYGGIELLKMVRKRSMDVPVILITGTSAPEGIPPSARPYVFKCLTKPVSMNDLIDAVEQATSSHSGTMLVSQSAFYGGSPDFEN